VHLFGVGSPAGSRDGGEGFSIDFTASRLELLRFYDRYNHTQSLCLHLARRSVCFLVYLTTTFQLHRYEVSDKKFQDDK